MARLVLARSVGADLRAADGAKTLLSDIGKLVHKDFRVRFDEGKNNNELVPLLFADEGKITMTIAELFLDNPPIGFDEEARHYSTPFGNNLIDWWQNAPRANWLIWVAGYCGVETQLLVLAAVDCARHTFFLIPHSFRTFANCTLDLLEKWTQGKRTIDDCAKASNHIFFLMDQVSETCSKNNNTAAALTALGAVEAAASSAWFSQKKKYAFKWLPLLLIGPL